MDNELQRIAQEIMLSQSFDYPSFAIAEHEIQFACNGNHHRLCYDRLSFCVYQHDLSVHEFFQLGKYLDEWEKRKDKEAVKKRFEYAILFHYMRFHEELYRASIRKETRPDFILTIDDTETIGIEVTRFSTPADNIMNGIVGKYSRSDLSLEEINQRIEKEHGKKAALMQIGRFTGNALWCSNRSGLLLSDVPFVANAERKITKYREMVKDFDRFILLCDAQSGITITSKANVEDLLQKIALENPNCGVTIAVLYLDHKSRSLCSEMNLSNSKFARV